MQGLVKHMQAKPSLFALIGVVGGTVTVGLLCWTYKMQTDKEFVFDPKDDPAPHLRQTAKPCNSVFGRKEPQNTKDEHYDLLDILNGKHESSS